MARLAETNTPMAWPSIPYCAPSGSRNAQMAPMNMKKKKMTASALSERSLSTPSRLSPDFGNSS